MNHRNKWFWVSLALAALVGYWFGSRLLVNSTNQEQPITETRWHNERQIINHDKDQAVRDMVERALTGASNDRTQWQQIRRLSEDEVKFAIAEIGNDSNSNDVLGMLFYRWGELNPVAANEYARDKYPEKFQNPRRAVITAWINQGGSIAAWNEVKEEMEIWDCTITVAGDVADMIAASMSNLSHAEAFHEVAKFNDENLILVDSLCRKRAEKAWVSPESRDGFLAAARSYPTHPDSEDYVTDCAVRFLFREWVNYDLEQAKAGAISMNLTDKEREMAISELPYEERPKP